LVGTRCGQAIGPVLVSVGFKLTALLKTHFEVVLPLLGLVVLNVFLIYCHDSWRGQSALVLAHVVQLVAAHREVGLGAAHPCIDRLGLLPSLLDRLLVVRLGRKTFLGGALRDFEVLLG